MRRLSSRLPLIGRSAARTPPDQPAGTALLDEPESSASLSAGRRRAVFGGLRAVLLWLPLLSLLMGPDGVPRERPLERAALQSVEDRGDKLPDDETMVRLAKDDPIQFLQWSIIRCQREVKGYRVNMRKQERIKGALKPSEDILVCFREEPFSVLFDYQKPVDAKYVLYIKPDDFSDKNRGRLLAKTAGLLSIQLSLSPDDDRARDSSRYAMYDFGIKVGSERTLHSWVAAKNDDALHIKFMGEKKIKELGNRPCWVLRRTGYRKPEEDGITEATFYFDKETWLQVGNVLKNRNGDLIGEYLFRDLELNPKFDDDVFTKKSFKK
jgi:hypothetical protein